MQYHYSLCCFDYLSTGNRTRAEDIRDHAHPYMRPGPFFPGQFPAANVQLLKDGRLAPTGMELGSGDPRLGTLDIGKQSIQMRVRECTAYRYTS